MRFTLDTNILFYALDNNAGDRHRAALDLVRRARGRDCVVTLQALSELFANLVKKAKIPPAKAIDIVQAWRDAVPIVAADEACLVDAMAAVANHGLSFWDAMIWATAKHAGCRILVSEDGQDGRALGGVTIVNPFALEPSPLLAEALGTAYPAALAVEADDERLRQVARLTEFLSADWGRRRGIRSVVAQARECYAGMLTFYAGSIVDAVFLILKTGSLKELLSAASVELTVVPNDWDGWDALRKTTQADESIGSHFTVIRDLAAGRSFFAKRPFQGWVNDEAYELLENTHAAARAYALGMAGKNS